MSISCNSHLLLVLLLIFTPVAWQWLCVGMEAVFFQHAICWGGRFCSLDVFAVIFYGAEILLCHLIRIYKQLQCLPVLTSVYFVTCILLKVLLAFEPFKSYWFFAKTWLIFLLYFFPRRRIFVTGTSRKSCFLKSNEVLVLDFIWVEFLVIQELKCRSIDFFLGLFRV